MFLKEMKKCNVKKEVHMKKRILCTLLSAAMLLTSSPVVFAAETQPVKEQQTKETLPFTIKEANNERNY